MQDVLERARYNASQLKLESVITITNPQHHLFGQIIKGFHIDHGNSSIAIEREDGSRELIPLSWTDYVTSNSPPSGEGLPLLELKGLLEMLKIIKHFKEGEE
jgi:hypothetical protein